MKFSLFYLTSYFPDLHGSEQAFYRQILAQIDEGERMGLYATWFAEHHFFDYGGHVPSPAVMLAAVAQRTERMKLGSGIAMIGLQDPIRTAEQYAMVDHLSGGRLLFGIGRGFQKCEFDAFQRDMSESRVVFDEAHDVIRRAWTEESFSFEGKYTRVKNLRVIPKPLQKPTPPFYVACLFTPQSFAWTAAQGYDLMIVPYATPDLSMVKGNIDAYLRRRQASGVSGEADVMPVLHFYCGENAEEAKETPRAPLMRYLGAFAASAREDAYSDQYAAYTGLSEALTKFDYDTFMYPERVIFGDPDQCVARIRHFQALGATHVSFVVDFGGIAHEKVLASLERFQRHVMPKFS